MLILTVFVFLMYDADGQNDIFCCLLIQSLCYNEEKSLSITDMILNDQNSLLSIQAISGVVDYVWKFI